MTFNWSKIPFILGFLYSACIALLEHFLDLHISLPWQPIAILGIAVAFYLGFKNNSSYDRLWEARKIYGGITNDSRSFASGVTSFIQGKDEDKVKKELIYRHIAWLTALRYQLRLAQPWEHIQDRVSGIHHYVSEISEEYIDLLGTELKGYIDETEVAKYLNKHNIATQLLNTQARRLQELKDQGYFNEFQHIRLFELINSLYDNQGKAERIKSFPLPRQYSSAALYLTVIFALSFPFGLYNLFDSVSGWLLVGFPLISGTIIWTFYLMEKIGDYSENPFEGTYNDVPITAISRNIEIDLREMINDENIPKPTEDENGFLL
jgi:ion channel-forming bestrophin family protein